MNTANWIEEMEVKPLPAALLTAALVPVAVVILLLLAALVVAAACVVLASWLFAPFAVYHWCVGIRTRQQQILERKP